jgi:hypothetical protein
MKVQEANEHLMKSIPAEEANEHLINAQETNEYLVG